MQFKLASVRKRRVQKKSSNVTGFFSQIKYMFQSITSSHVPLMEQERLVLSVQISFKFKLNIVLIQKTRYKIHPNGYIFATLFQVLSLFRSNICFLCRWFLILQFIMFSILFLSFSFYKIRSLQQQLTVSEEQDDQHSQLTLSLIPDVSLKTQKRQM